MKNIDVSHIPAGALFDATADSTATPELWAAAWTACVARAEFKAEAEQVKHGAIFGEPVPPMAAEFQPFMALGDNDAIDENRLGPLFDQAFWRQGDDVWIQRALDALPELAQGHLLRRTIEEETADYAFLVRLVDLGAKTTVPASSLNSTLLMIAAVNNNSKAFDFLLPLANIHQANARGDTALSLMLEIAAPPLLNAARVSMLVPPADQPHSGVSPFTSAMSNGYSTDAILEMFFPPRDIFSRDREVEGHEALDLALCSYRFDWACKIFETMQRANPVLANERVRASATLLLKNYLDGWRSKVEKAATAVDFCCARDWLTEEQEILFLEKARPLGPEKTPIAHARAERRALMAAANAASVASVFSGAADTDFVATPTAAPRRSRRL